MPSRPTSCSSMGCATVFSRSCALPPRKFVVICTTGGTTSGYAATGRLGRSEEHTSELQSLRHLVCRLLLEKKPTVHDSTPFHPPTHTPPSPAAPARHT